MTDLLYSDTEEALRDSVRHLFADRCPPEAVARSYDSVPQDFSGVWRTLAAELGVAGLLVPESLGGAGAGAREAAVVMEEIGRAVAPCRSCPALSWPPSRCCAPVTARRCRPWPRANSPRRWCCRCPPRRATRSRGSASAPTA